MRRTTPNVTSVRSVRSRGLAVRGRLPASAYRRPTRILDRRALGLAVLGRAGGDQRLQKIVRQKGEGTPVELPQDDEAEPDAPPDLMAVLEQALEAAQK